MWGLKWYKIVTGAVSSKILPKINYDNNNNKDC